MKNLVGRKVKVIEKGYEGIEGVIVIHEINDAQREVVRLNITKGRTPITDYFLEDVELMIE